MNPTTRSASNSARYGGSPRCSAHLLVEHGDDVALFPFTGHALSRRALDAALRLAVAEHATLVPVFLVRVPMQLPLESPLARQCTDSLPPLETIAQRAARLGAPVDAHSKGFQPDDVAWPLDHAPGEVVIIRPSGEDRIAARRPSANGIRARENTSAQPIAD